MPTEPVTAAPVDLTGIETSQVAHVEGVGCTYVVLWTPNAPNYLVRCDPSGPTTGPYAVESCVLFETTSLLDALVRVGVIVTAEVAAEMGS